MTEVVSCQILQQLSGLYFPYLGPDQQRSEPGSTGEMV